MSQSEQQSPDSTQLEQTQQSAKQRIELQRGKNIPIDYFLYSCLEHERTQRAQYGNDLPTGGRWPFMVGATSENQPADFASQSLKALMNRMCGWYAAQYPELVEEIPLDHEVLNHVVAPFMTFTLDLADLVLLKTGTSLPSHNADTEESKAVWADIAYVLKDCFPGYHGYFIRFLKWAFADVEPEEFEPGSRPPVGKNMPNFRAMAQTQHRPTHQQPQHQGGGPRHHQQRDTRSGQGQNYGGNNQRGRHQNQNPIQNRHSQKPQQQADAETEKLALGAVDDAIAKIQSGEVEEVFLKPMNSFYRRIQHQYAVDKGFESCSVGDGNERGVKVSKPLKK